LPLDRRMRTCKSKTTHLFRTAYSLITQMGRTWPRSTRLRLQNIGANVPSLTMTNDQEVQHATGVLISHELGHALLSPLHNPSGGIMHTGLGLSGLDIFHNDVTGNQRFTPQEASVIQSDCNFKHPPVSGKAAEDQGFLVKRSGSGSSVGLHNFLVCRPKDYNEVCCICFC